MLVDWKKKKIRRVEGAGGFVREKNHSLSIRAKACHLLAPWAKNKITRHEATHTPGNPTAPISEPFSKLRARTLGIAVIARFNTGTS